MLSEWLHVSKHTLQMGMALVVLMAILISRRAILHMYFRRKGNHFRDHFVVTINQVTFILTGILLFFVVLLLFRVNIREFLTSMTLVAAALALVFKDYVNNAFNGMILMFSDAFSVGDDVLIGSHRGKIEGINLLNVQLRTPSQELVLIANNLVLQLVTVNYSRGALQLKEFSFSVPARILDEWPLIEKKLDQQLAALFEEEHIRYEGALEVKGAEAGKLHCVYQIAYPGFANGKIAEASRLIWICIAEFQEFSDS